MAQSSNNILMVAGAGIAAWFLYSNWSTLFPANAPTVATPTAPVATAVVAPENIPDITYHSDPGPPQMIPRRVFLIQATPLTPLPSGAVPLISTLSQ